jgi:DNA-binding NtrC family response regulator
VELKTAKRGERDPDHGRYSASLDGADPRHLESVERKHVLAVLQEEKGVKVHAAKALGISRRALYRLLEKYQLPTNSNA